MVLANVLERFQDLETVVEDEFNAIESMRDSLVYLNLQRADKAEFYQVLLAYLQSMAGAEWDNMANQYKSNAIKIDSDTNDELLAIHHFAAKLIHQKPRGAVAVELISVLIIPVIIELGKFRTHRLALALAEAQLPPRLKFLLIWMIFFLVIGFILMSVENLYLNMFMTVAVSGAIQWLFTLIQDLDHPFYGIWNVSRAQLDTLIVKFEKQCAELSVAEEDEEDKSPHQVANDIPNATFGTT